MGFVKFILTAIGLVLILLGLAGAWGLSYAQKEFRGDFETHASAICGTSVRTGGVAINPFTRQITLRELQIDNPEGFDAGPMLRIETVRAAVEPDSLLRPPVQISSLELEDVFMHVQQQFTRGINLVRVIEAAESAAGGASAEPAGPKMLVNSLHCGRTAVKLSAGLLPRYGVDVKGDPFTLNPYQLAPLGPAQLAAELLQTIAKETRIAQALFDGRASLETPASPRPDDTPAEAPVVGGGAPEE